MRLAGMALLFLSALPLAAQERKVSTRDIDKQLFDVLKEVHNRGADHYNEGRALDCYRLYQGSLTTTRAVLSHRPSEQKFIDDAFRAADRHASMADRAFALHQSIEELRKRLRTPTKEDGGPELVTVPPRETKQERPVPEKILPPKDGVMGVVFWNGSPLSGAEVLFVTRGSPNIRIVEGTTDADGRYVLEKLPPGKYTVLLTRPGKKMAELPERYATVTTSPLIVDVKGGGDQLDFLLQ